MWYQPLLGHEPGFDHKQSFVLFCFCFFCFFFLFFFFLWSTSIKELALNTITAMLVVSRDLGWAFVVGLFTVWLLQVGVVRVGESSLVEREREREMFCVWQWKVRFEFVLIWIEIIGWIYDLCKDLFFFFES